MSAWAGVVGALAVAVIVAMFVTALRPPRPRREVLPPIPRRALDALPPADSESTP